MKPKRSSARVGATLLTLALLATTAASARATTLKTAMQKLADGLSAELRRGDIGGDSPSVFVDLPDGPPGDGATTRMKKELVDALKAKEVKIGNQLTADLKVAMAYSRTDGTNRYSMEVRVKNRSNQSLGVFNGNFTFDNTNVEFVDNDTAKGDEKVELTIDDPKERATIEGANVDATIGENGRAQKATDLNVSEQLNAKDEVFIAPGTTGDVNSLVSAREGSKFRIEILVRPRSDDPEKPLSAGRAPYAPRAVEDLDGMALCELKEGEAYAVRVINDADHAVAVDLSIDGINMWTTSGVPAWKKRGLFHVDARSSTLIRGWHFGTLANPHLYREFTVVTLPQSLAVELGSKDESQIGQVSAQFFAAWPEGADPPFVEAKGAQGTGVGEEFQQETRNVRVHVGQSLLAALTVRYVRPEPLDLPPGEAAPGGNGAPPKPNLPN